MNIGSKEEAPLVSVIIPTFNRKEVLQQAISSALDQKGAMELEVIVVDDCSTDETEGLVRSFRDKRIKYIRHSENRGGAAARNTGVSLATGEFVAFLDSDDTWDGGKLSAQLFAIRGSTKPEMAVCYSKLRCRRTSYTEILPSRGKRRRESVADYLFLRGGLMQTSSILVGVELARRTMFDPSWRKHQDYDYCLRLEQAGAEFVFVEQPLLTWNHDSREDRISNLYGIEISEAFLVRMKDYLSRPAAEAFWVRHIFPKKLREAPIDALARFIATVFWGALPIGWFWGWMKGGIRRRLSRVF